MSWKESRSPWIEPDQEEENAKPVPFGVPEFIYNVPDNPPQELPDEMWYRANQHAYGYGSGWKDIGTYRDPIWVNSYGSKTRENQLKNYPENLVYGVEGNPYKYRPTNVQDMSAVRQIGRDWGYESRLNDLNSMLAQIFGDDYIE